ncbi:hypothetical protein ElyMa_001333800 [Elysia marginata]|uniref:Secreted protein n=1 Tax=Elysia marginata TaxID=1093978 RepID=A0AAV4IPJ3_9GAST|nr:hypothetical protein ElyMa_001333800 [Elysia marginata]
MILFILSFRLSYTVAVPLHCRLRGTLALRQEIVAGVGYCCNVVDTSSAVQGQCIFDILLVDNAENFSFCAVVNTSKMMKELVPCRYQGQHVTCTRDATWGGHRVERSRV